jgi:hypothetical protein
MADLLFPTSPTVKKLRAYYQDKLENVDIAHIRDVLSKESDRAIAILAGSILDDLLQYRIEKALHVEVTEAQARHIFRYEGPIGAFSHRIEIAYIFGIIDKLTARQLQLIREMRNACAHSIFELSFDKPELANVAKMLFRPNGVVELLNDTAAGIRDALLREFPTLIMILTLGSRESGIIWVTEHFPAWLAENAPLPDRSTLRQTPGRRE